jgi:hypothetical protein
MTAFKLKKVLVNTKDYQSKIQKIREEWLTSFLKRINVPDVMIEKRQSLKISKEDWAHYLLTTFKIKIEFNVESETVKVLKLVEKPSSWKEEVIAEWNKPEVLKKKEGSEPAYFEVTLKYWSLI